MKDYGLLYRQLTHLIGTMPDLQARPSDATYQAWLGRAYALVNEVDQLVDAEALKRSSRYLGETVVDGPTAALEIQLILYRAIAVAELRAPPSITGAFIPVGATFDAFTAIAKIVRGAKSDVLIVDPYLDCAVLENFGSAIPDGVVLRLLADASDVKASLKPAVSAWKAQFGASRPLEARLAPTKTLHDRAIIVDGDIAWTITQSFNKLAARAPAEIIRNDEIAPRKVAAYQDLWDKSTALV